MQEHGRGSTRRRRIRDVIAAALLALLAALVVFAYGYQPPEARDHRSAYLEQVETRFVDTSAFRIHYLHVGEGEPVVLLPGGGTWLYELRGLIDALAPHYAVYALDPPGSGYTTPRALQPRYDLPAIDRTLVEFMDQLQIARATLIGHSFGGGYALYFAEQHPERVTRLVSLAGVGLDLPYVPLFEAMKWPVAGELSTKVVTPELMRVQLEGLVVDKTKITDEMVREWYIPATFRSNRAGLVALTRQLDWRLTEQGLATLKPPVLLVWGRDDQLQPVARLERWRELLPHAEVRILEQAGHLLQVDQQATLNETVLDFLFDGVCNLCNASISFIIERDPHGVFRFAPLQGDTAQRLLADAELPFIAPEVEIRARQQTSSAHRSGEQRLVLRTGMRASLATTSAATSRRMNQSGTAHGERRWNTRVRVKERPAYACA